MQFNIHLVIFASGHENELYYKQPSAWSGKSYLTLFPLTFETSGKPVAFDHNHAEQIDLNTDYPTLVSPAVKSNEVGRVNLGYPNDMSDVIYLISGWSL